jgi:hypothetical protein
VLESYNADTTHIQLKMLSYTSIQKDPQMCRIGISPPRGRSTLDEPHEFEQNSRPRPISIVASPTRANISVSPTRPAMQHTKRSSIYVSDASIFLSHRAPVLSPTSDNDTLMSPTSSDTPGVVDHYANLELPPNASIDEVKAAFRRLRGLYFTTDAVKYRAAQAAFDVLANPAARQEYDSTYRARPTSIISSLGDVMEQSKHGRKDSAHNEESPMATLAEEVEAEAVQSEDPNWALKHHRRLYEPVTGTQPYGSFVPILAAYNGWTCHPRLKSRRPKYVGQAAKYAFP